MIRPRRSPPLALAVLVLAAAQAHAQQDGAAAPSAAPDFARTGPYLGLAGTLAIATSAEEELEASSGGLPFDVDPSLGLHARAGWRLLPRLAAEVHYEWLGGFDIAVEPVGSFPRTEVAEVEAWTLTADGKVFLLTGRGQPFLTVGVGALHAELTDRLGLGVHEEDTGFAARFGGGLDVYATEHVVLGLDVAYVVPTGDVSDLDYVSIGWGLQYRF